LEIIPHRVIDKSLYALIRLAFGLISEDNIIIPSHLQLTTGINPLYLRKDSILPLPPLTPIFSSASTSASALVFIFLAPSES